MLCPSSCCDRRRGEAGFTLIEVLIALSLLAVSLAAIGTLTAASVRSARHAEQSLALMATARAVETALPDPDQLTVGTRFGNMAGQQWRVDVQPLAPAAANKQAPTSWIALSVLITVKAADGQSLQLSTVRLRPTRQP